MSERSEVHGLIARAVTDGEYERARSLLRRLSTAEPRDMVSMVIDLYDECGDFEPLIVTPDPERAAAAVVRAAERFYCIGDNGYEYADLDQAEEHADEVYTPNAVSDVYLPDARLGLTFWVDTKDLLNTAMGETMCRVLIEELVAAAVPAHVCRRPPGLDWTGRRWPVEPEYD